MKNLYFYVLALIALACASTASAGTYRVWLKNTKSWPKIHCYNWQDGGGCNAAWPGSSEVGYDTQRELYYYDANTDYPNIIFNNGSSGDKNQTPDIKSAEANAIYNCDGVKIGSIPVVKWVLVMGSATASFNALTTTGTFRAFEVAANEGKLSLTGYDVYDKEVCTFGSANNIVESGNYDLTKGESTGQCGLNGAYNFDLTIAANEAEGTYTCKLAVEKTAFVYFEKPADWATAYAYAWADKPMETFPGKAMTHVADNLYRAAVESWCQKILFVDNNNRDGHRTKDLELMPGCKYSFSKNNDGSVDITPSADAPAAPSPVITMNGNDGDVVGETLRYVKTDGMTTFTVSFQYDQPYTLYYRVVYMEVSDVQIPGYSKAPAMVASEPTEWTRVDVNAANTADITLNATQGKLHLAALVDNQLTNPTEYWFGEKGVITGVESIDADNTDAPAAYYTLQGARVAQPVSGNLYIRIQNGKATKTLVR